MTDYCQADWDKIVNDDKQPKLILHNDDDCGGSSDDVKKGKYYRDDLEDMKNDMDNDVNVMIIPPNMRALVCADDDLNKCDDDYIGPGIVHLDSTEVGKNDLSSFEVVETEPWDHHLIKCCISDGDQNECGQFWGGSNTGACDDIMLDYCKENPKHQKCACFNAKDEQGNEIPQPQCFFSPCSNSDAYKLSSWSNIACGSYCKQVLDIGGSTNTVIDGANFTQYCGDDATTGGGGGNSGGFNEPNGLLSIPESFNKNDLIEWSKNNIIVILFSVFLIFIVMAIFILFIFI